MSKHKPEVVEGSKAVIDRYFPIGVFNETSHEHVFYLSVLYHVDSKEHTIRTKEHYNSREDAFTLGRFEIQEKLRHDYPKN